MIHYFVYGQDGKRGLFLTQEQADLVNRFTRSFLDSQHTFRQIYRRQWTPLDPIAMEFGGLDQLHNEADLDAYNRLTKLMDTQWWVRSEILRLPCKDHHVTGDMLVRRF